MDRPRSLHRATEGYAVSSRKDATAGAGEGFAPLAWTFTPIRAKSFIILRCQYHKFFSKFLVWTPSGILQSNKPCKFIGTLHPCRWFAYQNRVKYVCPQSFQRRYRPSISKALEKSAQGSDQTFPRTVWLQYRPTSKHKSGIRRSYLYI